MAGRLRFERSFHGVKLFGDTDGDGAADLQILLTLNTEIISADLILSIKLV